MPVGTKGSLRASCLRLIAANSRIIGAAPGTIMAIIMIHHMRAMSMAYESVQAIDIGIVWP